jgi:hypothetical protein
MKLELTPAERDLVLRILESVLAETRVEVRRTSTPKYHDALEEESQTIQSLVERLRSLGGA